MWASAAPSHPATARLCPMFHPAPRAREVKAHPATIRVLSDNRIRRSLPHCAYHARAHACRAHLRLCWLRRVGTPKRSGAASRLLRRLSTTPMQRPHAHTCTPCTCGLLPKKKVRPHARIHVRIHASTSGHASASAAGWLAQTGWANLLLHGTIFE